MALNAAHPKDRRECESDDRNDFEFAASESESSEPASDMALETEDKPVRGHSGGRLSS